MSLVHQTYPKLAELCSCTVTCAYTFVISKLSDFVTVTFTHVKAFCMPNVSFKPHASTLPSVVLRHKVLWSTPMFSWWNFVSLGKTVLNLKIGRFNDCLKFCNWNAKQIQEVRKIYSVSTNSPLSKLFVLSDVEAVWHCDLQLAFAYELELFVQLWRGRLFDLSEKPCKTPSLKLSRFHQHEHWWTLKT